MALGVSGSSPDAEGSAATAPLSLLQEQLWLVQRTAPGSDDYHELWALRLEGAVDPSRLQQALNSVVDRHEVLRITVGEVDRTPVARVHPAVNIPLELLPHGEHAVVAGSDPLVTAAAFAERPYDLANGPLLRTGLIRLAPDRQILVIGSHHIVMDGWSMVRLLGDLAVAYRDPAASARDRPAPYRLFAQRQRDRDAVDAEALRFWETALAGAPTVLNLPTDRPRGPRRHGRGRRDSFPLPEALPGRLRQLSEVTGGSILPVLLSAFGALLHRHAETDDLVVGTGVPGRLDPRFDRTVGLFANMVPVRLRLDGSDRVRDLLERTSDAVFDALDHQHVPFETIVRTVDPQRDPAITPLVQVVFTVWDPTGLPGRIGDATITVLDVPRRRSRFDLLFELVADADLPRLYVEYDTDLFDGATVGRMVEHLRRLLKSMAADPRTAVRDLPGGGAAAFGARARRVRIRGFVVREDEIEAVLSSHPAVVQATVGSRRTLGGSELLAKALVRPGTAVTGAELVAHLARHVPRSVLPRKVTVLSGDGGTVPPPEPATVTRTSTPALHAAVSTCWSTTLGLDSIAPDDDFFALGGHSMLAARLADELARTLGIPLGPLELFEHPTVGELCAVLASRHPDLEPALAKLDAMTPVELTALAEVAEPTGPGPDIDASASADTEGLVSTAELQLWTNQQLMPAAGQDFVSPLMYRIEGPLDVAALRAAFETVTARHAVLRSGYRWSTGGTLSRRAEAVRPSLQVVDLSDLPAAAHAPRVGELALEAAGTPFALDEPPLLRLRLLRLGEREHVLVLVLHHLITDAVSMQVLTAELSHLYAGRLPALLPPTQPYSSYVEWERAWLASAAARQSREYWSRTLAGAPRLLVPADDREAEGFATDIRTLRLDRAATEAALDCARSHGVTPFALVTAAFAAVLGRWAGQDDVVIGTLVDNRPSGFDNVVGCVANAAALRVDLRAAPSFASLLERVRSTVLGAYIHQHLPFSQVVAAVGGGSSAQQMPLFQVTSAWTDPRQVALDLHGCRVRHDYVPVRTNRFELSLFAGLYGNRIVLDLEYHRKRWRPETISARSGEIVTLLDRAVATPAAPLSDLLGDSSDAA